MAATTAFFAGAEGFGFHAVAGSPFHLDLAAPAVAAAPPLPLPPLVAAQGAAPPLLLAAAAQGAAVFPAAALRLSQGGGGGPAASGGLLDGVPGGVLGPAKFALAGSDHDGRGGGAALLADAEPASSTWPGCPSSANEGAAPSTVGRGGGMAHGQVHGTVTTVRRYWKTCWFLVTSCPPPPGSQPRALSVIVVVLPSPELATTAVLK